MEDVSAVDVAGWYCHLGLGSLACNCVNARDADTLVICGCVLGLLTMPLYETQRRSGVRRFGTDSNSCGCSDAVEFYPRPVSCAGREVRCWTYQFTSCMSFLGPGWPLLSFATCTREAFRVREARVQRAELREAAAAAAAQGSQSVIVTTLTGEPVRVRFEVGEDIRFFKQRIAGLVGVPVLNQRLVCDGAELRRGTMTAANVGAGARISLIVVLREEGERAAAEDVQLDREERRNAASLRPTQGVQLAD